jgi:hypothetical protein
MLWIIPLLLLFVVLLHESGHYIAAKLQGLIVDKFSFSLKPLPHFYVSIIDYKISMRERILFLLSGNFIILLIFVTFILSGINYKYLYYAFVYQIIVDTNPFYSDYVVAIISYSYRKWFRKQHIENDINTTGDMTIDNLKDIYMFSPIWYLHCLIWGLLIILLVSPKFLNNYF